MAKTKKVLHEEIRAKFMKLVSDCLAEKDEEILVVGSNEIALPVVDTEGEERWLVLTFKVPTGSRDGDAYDGYSMKEDYEMKLAEKAEKAAEKAKKAEKDKAKREAAAKAKEKSE